MKFYECPKCGFFHPSGFNGTCDDTENRYDLDQLEEEHPDWQEVDPPLAEVIANPNLHRLQQLTPEIDLNGNRLEIGCNVRVYPGGHYIPETDALAGIAITTAPGPQLIVEGALEKINFLRSSVDIATMLTAAADFLQQRGWHRFTRDNQGHYVSGLDNTAQAFGIDHALFRSVTDNRDREAAWATLAAATAPDKPIRWSEAEGRTQEQVIELLRQCAEKPIAIDDPTPYYVIRTASNGMVRVVVNGHLTNRCTDKNHVHLPGESCPSFIVFRM